jgi:carbonic anhydrase
MGWAGPSGASLVPTEEVSMTALRSPALQAVLALVALAWGAPPASAEQGSTPHWTYEGDHGPSHWGSLDAAYRTCRAGRHQSPIDIHGAKTVALPPIVFAYKPSPLRIIDNGHTVQVTYAPGSFITVGDQQYELQQLHFHHPAEETVDGRSYPLEAHLVHKNAKGALAVVAVLLRTSSSRRYGATSLASRKRRSPPTGCRWMPAACSRPYEATSPTPGR